MAPDSKKCVNLKRFLFFVINSTLCHLFESPHRGDSNGMPQRIGSVNCVIYSNRLIKAILMGCHNVVKKISQILVRFSFYLSLY